MVLGSTALWLGVYSTIVSTAVALLTLYAEVFLRVKVIPRSGFYGSDGGPAFHESEDEFPATGQTLEPAFGVNVSNRGRQTVWVGSIHQARAFESHRTFAWVTAPYGGPAYVAPNSTLRFTVGGEWTPENTRARRFFIIDGVGVIHPLRERWRMRIENVLFRRALLWAQARARPDRAPA